MKKITFERPGLHMTAAIMLSFALFVFNAQAQDADNDGFTDLQERAGIQLIQGVTLPDGTSFLGLCGPNALATDPCVDPAGPDVFVILARATAGSLIPTNPLGFMVNLLSSFGVHEIGNSPNNPDRFITSVSQQKAIRITEDLNTNDTIWGRSLFQGTPNTAGEATVFAQRIKNALDQKYLSATGTPAPQAVVDDCIRHTIAHEAGHNELIASQYNSRFGGNHYSTSDKVVMSQSATITVKGSRVTVICPNTYASPDVTGFRLR
jgi:hypothetical protein